MFLQPHHFQQQTRFIESLLDSRLLAAEPHAFGYAELTPAGQRFNSAVTTGPDCTVLGTTSHWFGVTYPEDKQHVVASIRKLIETGEYPADLSQGAAHA